MRIPIVLTFVALALAGCNANQAINPSGQANLCANDPSCNPYNPSQLRPEQRRDRPLTAGSATEADGLASFRAGWSPKLVIWRTARSPETYNTAVFSPDLMRREFFTALQSNSETTISPH